MIKQGMEKQGVEVAIKSWMVRDRRTPALELGRFGVQISAVPGTQGRGLG